MIQIYDYMKFYDKKVEVKIDNEIDLIQFLDYLKLLNREEVNYYEQFTDWCNLKEVEKKAIRKIEDISRKYGYTSTLAEIDKHILNGANEIFNKFWQELELNLESLKLEQHSLA